MEKARPAVKPSGQGGRVEAPLGRRPRRGIPSNDALAGPVAAVAWKCASAPGGRVFGAVVGSDRVSPYRHPGAARLARGRQTVTDGEPSSSTAPGGYEPADEIPCYGVSTLRRATDLLPLSIDRFPD